MNLETINQREQRKARIQKLQRMLCYYATTHNESASVTIIRRLLAERKTA